VEPHRDVVLNADLWPARPEILSAGFGFEGIIGIPGLFTPTDLGLAVMAGAGVNLHYLAVGTLPACCDGRRAATLRRTRTVR
jgi:hypothetical protein